MEDYINEIVNISKNCIEEFRIHRDIDSINRLQVNLINLSNKVYASNIDGKDKNILIGFIKFILRDILYATYHGYISTYNIDTINDLKQSYLG